MQNDCLGLEGKYSNIEILTIVQFKTREQYTAFFSITLFQKTDTQTNKIPEESLLFVCMSFEKELYKKNSVLFFF